MLREKEKAHKQERKEDKNTSFRLFFIVLAIFCSCNLSNVSAEEVKPSSVDVFSQSLDDIEEKIFHINYSGDKKEDRLSRLEEFIFGAKYENKTPEDRLKKITSSIQQKPQPKVEKTVVAPAPIEVPPIKEEPKIVYDENTANGAFGTITQIEKNVFNRSFEDLPFKQRIEQLEAKMLSRGELNKAKDKPLLERVTALIQKNNPKPLPVETQVLKPKTNPTRSLPSNGQRNYRIDPNTGQIVNELTGEVVTDSDGNPITVKMPTQIPQQPIYQDEDYVLPGFGAQQQYFPNQQGFPNQLQQYPGYGNQVNPLNQLNNFPIDPNY